MSEPGDGLGLVRAYLRLMLMYGAAYKRAEEAETRVGELEGHMESILWYAGPVGAALPGLPAILDTAKVALRREA